MNCASELDTGMDHDAELEHVHGPEPACMIEHGHTPSPAQQGAQIGTAGGRVDYALALGQRRTRGPELDTELDPGEPVAFFWAVVADPDELKELLSGRVLP